MLNDKIQAYNVYLVNHQIFAKMLKLEKMKYIDSENLEKSMELTDIDDFDI